MATNNAIDSQDPIQVALGGTGAATLTNHGVLVGAATNPITALIGGTNGQTLIGSTGANPVFAATTSTLSSIAFTTGAGTLNIDVSNYADKTSFTPVLNFGGASTGITYSTQTGAYSRFDNMVFVSGTLNLTSIGSATGNATIAGMPFTADSAQFYFINFVINSFTSVPSGQALFALINSNTSLVLYDQQSSAGGGIVNMTNANFLSTTTLNFSGWYSV